MIDIGTTLRHYKREDVRKEMVLAGTNREVAVKYGESGFGKRPDALSYDKDILEFAKQGATSFHVSEEHWSNVFQLSPELGRDKLDSLRTGWDLVIDIDCIDWDISRLTAHLVIQALKEHGIGAISCKFSGNKGFHIGVPFESFPKKVHGKETRLHFPDGARRIAAYISGYIKPKLTNELLKLPIEEIIRKTGKPREDVVKNGVFDPLALLEIDTLLISSRHLYRMPYSLHEKSGLCSVPIDPEKVLGFSKDLADPKKMVVPGRRFLDSTHSRENEAMTLIVQAFDSKIVLPEEKKAVREFESLTEAVPAELFAPCIKNILAGLEDGKKRAMFILINYLSNVGYDYDQIDAMLDEWNKLNREPLREVILKGRVRYSRHLRTKVLPPNCDNKAYYLDFRVCTPDGFCRRIRNPVNYTILKAKLAQPKPGREKLSEEQKEMRRKHRMKQKEGENGDTDRVQS